MRQKRARRARVQKVAAPRAATLLRKNQPINLASAFCAGLLILRRTSNPVSPSPKRATAEPPSGTALPFAENENIALVWPPAFWVVKAQVMAVGSNPLPLTIPLPSTVRDDAVRCVTVDERRSKVKPATLHRPGVGVDGLNAQGAVTATGVFIGIPAKSPVPPASTWALIQEVTVVAVSKRLY